MAKNYSEISAEILISLIQSDSLKDYDIQSLLEYYRFIYTEVAILGSTSAETLAKQFVKE